MSLCSTQNPPQDHKIDLKLKQNPKEIIGEKQKVIDWKLEIMGK